jgi:hypothetical protein
MFFAGEELNGQDQVLQCVPRRRKSMVAELLPAPPNEDAATRLIQWDIVLRRG